jgi:hypothetical protein
MAGLRLRGVIAVALAEVMGSSLPDACKSVK